MRINKLLFLPLWAASIAHAGELTVSVVDNEGNALNNIAVLAKSDAHPVPLGEALPLDAVMDQINRQFVPHTLVVQQGTHVSFPNSDSIQHHVYSFSRAKTFELQLYSELEIEPLLFDKPGVVELGCNVHDWMLGYIYVADTPFFGQTSQQGEVTISVPSGEFMLSVWHPRIDDADLAMQHTVTIGDSPQTITIQLKDDLLPSLVEYEAVEGFENY